MARKTKPGGGWQAIRYTIGRAVEVGPWRLWKRMRSRNACKTCALGMGGMKGGMVNEAGHFPEVCKKSLQAQAADMKGSLPGDFFDRNSLACLQKLTPKQAEDAGRISYPVVLTPGATHYKPITWDDALKHVADRLKEADPNRVAVYASGRSSNEAAFLLHSFARVYGTNHTNNCSFYCHQASGVGLKLAFGTGTATVTLDDLFDCDLVILIGANPASNHPRLMTQLANLRGRGGHVVVVNPIKESGLETFHIPSQLKSYFFGSKIASHYVQPLAGGDTAFLVGMVKHLDEKGLVKKDFLEKYTEGSQDILDHVRGLSWEEITAGSGVDKLTIEEIAEMVGSSKGTIFAWAMGITHHTWGVENVLALCNLALVTGQVGKPGAGLMPIRGHSNVQGIGSIGFSPALQDSVRQALEKSYKTTLPTTPGYDIFGMIEAADEGKVDFLFNLGGNLWGSNPDLDFAKRAMNKVKTTIYLSTKLNPGHFHGHGQTTIIFPVLARDEEPQATSQESMFNFVRLSEGGTQNVAGQIRAESDIICDIASRVLGDTPVDWNRLKSHSEVRKLIAEIIPGWKEIGDIDQTKKEFTIPGRVFHSPEKFPTASGKAVMHKTPLPEIDNSTLKLMTIRSEGQFNTVVYDEYDIYRGIPHRFCVMMAQEDIDRLNLEDGQRVTVKGEAGSLSDIEVVCGHIRPGVVAMFYPESNVLIKPRLDSRSKTPAFKCAPVWIEP